MGGVLEDLPSPSLVSTEDRMPDDSGETSSNSWLYAIKREDREVQYVEISSNAPNEPAMTDHPKRICTSSRMSSGISGSFCRLPRFPRTLPSVAVLDTACSVDISAKVFALRHLRGGIMTVGQQGCITPNNNSLSDIDIVFTCA